MTAGAIAYFRKHAFEVAAHVAEDRGRRRHLARGHCDLHLPPPLGLDAPDRAMTIGDRRVTLFAEVVNALNRRNERNVPYSIDRNGRVLGVTDSLLPIVPSAGFVVEF